MRPPPGTATEKDVIAALRGPRQAAVRAGRRRPGGESRWGREKSLLAGVIVRLLWQFVEPGRSRSRIARRRPPATASRVWCDSRTCASSPGTRLPGGEVSEELAIAELAPDLAVEVLSQGNTKTEMERKLRDYFRRRRPTGLAGLPEDADRRGLHRRPDEVRRIGKDRTLDGGDVLPGFRLPLKELFARAEYATQALILHRSSDVGHASANSSALCCCLAPVRLVHRERLARPTLGSPARARWPRPTRARSPSPSSTSSTGETYYLNADEPMPTASLIKVAVLIETYQQADEGKVKLTDKRHAARRRQGARQRHPHRALQRRRDLLAARRRAADDRLLGQHRDEPRPRQGRHRARSTSAWRRWGFPNTRINAKVVPRQHHLGRSGADEEVRPRLDHGPRDGRRCSRRLQAGDAVSPAAQAGHARPPARSARTRTSFTRLLPPGTVVAHKDGSVSDAPHRRRHHLHAERCRSCCAC